MIAQLFTIGLLMLFSAMLPGPDFALVTKNSLLYSRMAGWMTALGVGCALMIHVTYCALGFATVIEHSVYLYNGIRFVGGMYLVYLGISSFFAVMPEHLFPENVGSEIPGENARRKQSASYSLVSMWRQGFFCNLLNPKAAMFVLALFTMVIKPGVPLYIKIIVGIEFFAVSTLWFFTLAWMLSHPAVSGLLERAEKYISRVLGLFLFGFGLTLLVV